MSNIITGSQSLDPILTGLFYQAAGRRPTTSRLTAAPAKAIDGYTGQYLALRRARVSRSTRPTTPSRPASFARSA